MSKKHSLLFLLFLLTMPAWISSAAATSCAPRKKLWCSLPSVLNAHTKIFLYSYKPAPNTRKGNFLKNLLESSTYTVIQDEEYADPSSASSPSSSFALSGDCCTLAYADERHVNTARCLSPSSSDGCLEWRWETALYPDQSKGTIDSVALSRRGSTLHLLSSRGMVDTYKKVKRTYWSKSATPTLTHPGPERVSYPKTPEIEHVAGSPVSLTYEKIERGILCKLLNTLSLEQLDFLSSISHIIHAHPSSWIILTPEQTILFKSLPPEIKTVLLQWNNITTQATYNKIVAGRRRAGGGACVIS